MKLFNIMIIVLLGNQCHAGLFSWLFKKKNSEEKIQSPSSANIDDPSEVKDVATTAKIPFEIKSSDEKFLKEATQLGSISSSELDVCHHKVILSLGKSCADLNEEDLSKVAVNLLNCQSAVEYREVFPCTSEMSLSDCTRNMDSNTWNAYHIVSNRARAVCYASRQEQFGAKTQMAVNVLMHTAEEQIKSMNDLQEGQMALGKATSDTLDSLSQGHQHLKEQQQQLSSAHQHVHNYISVNLRELSREKKLIASGQRELAIITESIKRKIEEAKKQLTSQEDKQRKNHELILQDLSRIHDNALGIWEKLDVSTQNILQAHEETVMQYGQLMDDMQRMNATVHHLMDVLQSTKQGVEDQLSWITSLVGGTDNTIQKVYSCVLHTCYFFVGMISATFLQVPYFTRVVLVVLVPLNALAELRHDSSLPFSTLTIVLALCMIVKLGLSRVWSVYRRRKTAKCVHNVTSPHLTSGNSVETARELNNHSSKGSTNAMSSPSQKMNVLACDFSSDDAEEEEEEVKVEEQSSATPAGTFALRRRMFGNIGSVSKGEISDSYKDSVQNSESEAENVTLDISGKADTHVKTLSSVRRHLLDHLNSQPSRTFHHNVTLDNSDTASVSPLTDSLLNRSNASSRSLTPRKLCSSVCKNGQLCRNAVVGNMLHCHRHLSGSRASTPASRRTSRRSTPLRT